MYVFILDAVAVAAALICIRSFLLRRKQRAKLNPLPPGPRGLPIIGNILDMPKENEWETACQWATQYGDIVYINNLGTGYLFLNSYEDAVEMFERRGNIYSDRPQTTMLDLEGWHDWFTSVMPYGDKLRKARQYFNKMFQRSVVKDYYDMQTHSMRKLLLKLLNDPDGFQDHIRYTAADSIIKIVYGYEIEENDPYVTIIEDGVRAVADALMFYAVNALPPLRHLPKWFPGTRFHEVADNGRKLATIMSKEPAERAKVKMTDGTATPSVLSKLLELYAHKNNDDSDDTFIEQTVAVAFAAGGDTTVSVLLSFVLAMILFPDVMKKGQEELDRVIGQNKLPTFEDRPQLPYIEAICKECLRWQAVTPLGVPHLAEKDDIYKGYFIPAGTVMYANVWSILRDPKRYQDPEKFIPERWLVTGKEEQPLQPNKVAFGFGRRICPGRFLVENSVFIGIASILSMFDIQKAVNEEGVPITPDGDYIPGIVRHPKPFKCKITPRSEEAVASILHATC